MDLHVLCVLAALATGCAWSAAQESPCEEASVVAHTDAGWVYGGWDLDGDYAYFLAVPYAKQPLGELRFKELQRAEPWTDCRCATEVGPICPQRDLFYGPIMSPRGQSEECIHANVYVPLQSLPSSRARADKRQLLPVLVYVHGGGFDFGSGDPDAHGPQYLVKENVVVITFNYRVGAFGFLSLNSSDVPGNAGLRDMVTLLRWVQRNAEAFGGNPRDVTLAGQSAGASSIHLLSLSQAAQGLFKRAILMSGAGTRGFFTTSPAYAQTITELFFSYLGINSTDPDEVHRKLVSLPLDQIMTAHNQIQDYTGLLAFTPVVESEHPGVERILDGDPEALQAQGRGKDIPFLIGFTNAECETFRPRFGQIDIVQRINNMELLMLPPSLIFSTPPAELPSKINSIKEEYFSGGIDLDSFLRWCSDFSFIYPALKLAESRAANKGAPVFLYRFAYNAENSVYKKALNLTYVGAGHSEDLTFVFRANHVLADTVKSSADDAVVEQMTTYFTNFMRRSNPLTIVDEWRAVSARKDKFAPYNDIVNYEEADPWPAYRRMKKFFDSIYESS